ncbi:unnamed protein product [Paramecium primaurelia]|uniref:EF-hand domain-containing protein n=1 Tax=Paramecium primaurelia TaxID=5886 RepID=A0A8S1PWF1_PARPR|nr:unnamed protein product [Paramecium primaurelia]
MLPSVTPIKEFQSQPLVRKIMKSQLESTIKSNKSSSDIINKQCKSSYQHYRKQNNQQEEIQVQKLFFRNRESSSRDTPPSFLITKHFESRQEMKPLTIEETKYQEKIEFHGKRMKINQDSIENNLMKSFQRFRLQENVCQRSIVTSQRAKRSSINMEQISTRDRFFTKSAGMRQIVIVNQLYLNTSSLQYIFMYVPDHSIKDKSIFEEFTSVVKNRLKINSKKIYFYLKDGTPVYSHLDIPPKQSVLIYSTSTVYKQIFNPQLLYLENCCSLYNCEEITKKNEPDYTQQIDSIIHTLVHQNYQSIDDEYQVDKVPEEIEINQQFMNSKELKHSYKEIKRNKNFKPIINKMFQPCNAVKQKNYLQQYMNDEYIIKNPKIEKLEKIEGWYEQELKKIKFKPEEENSNEDLMAVHVDSISSQQTIENQISQAAKLLEPLLKKFLNNNSGYSKEDGPEVNFNNDEEEEKAQTINHIQQNIKELITNKGSLHKLLKINKELFIQGIPKILNETNFSRYELHNTYILYCALQQITSQRYRFYNVDDGVDYNTYRMGIYQIFMQSEYLAQEIFNKIDFNYSGFLNWNEFLKLMVSIRAKTLVQKLDLFIQISDKDGNGQLCWDEIFQLSKVCLSKYIQNSDDFLDMLCEYYTRLIFKVVEKEPHEEIPFSAIKDAILQQKEDSDLLCMFCGADI